MKRIKKISKTLAKARYRALVIFNGIFGDSLEKHQSSFSIQMRIYGKNKPLTLSKKKLNEAGLPRSGKICLLAHGMCGSEKGWNFKEDPSRNYGSLLEKDKGFTPLFLRYNSGLHISENGKRLSDLLEQLVLYYPVKITELVLVGHSMGGLVFRSACYYGEKEQKSWVKQVKKIFYLGSPHLGNHFELLGKITTSILSLIPNPITKAIVKLGDLRSAGIKDLRHGYITEEEWSSENADKLFYWHENKTPLLKSAKHFLICGTIAKDADSKWGRILGDGVVHPSSATGRSLFTSSPIPFVKDHCKTFAGTSHIELQKSLRVYEQILAWC